MFLVKKENCLKRLEFKCFLVRVKFGSEPIENRKTCAIKKQPLTLLDEEKDEDFFTLVEVFTPDSICYRLKTTYQDYAYTVWRTK